MAKALCHGYFCQEVDRPSGLPVLPTMIAEGFSVLPQPSTLLQEARRIAIETLRSGPSPLSTETVRAGRYMISRRLGKARVVVKGTAAIRRKRGAQPG
jgi:hypothetical protein